MFGRRTTTNRETITKTCPTRQQLLLAQLTTRSQSRRKRSSACLALINYNKTQTAASIIGSSTKKRHQPSLASSLSSVDSETAKTDAIFPSKSQLIINSQQQPEEALNSAKLSSIHKHSQFSLEKSSGHRDTTTTTTSSLSPRLAPMPVNSLNPRFDNNTRSATSNVMGSPTTPTSANKMWSSSSSSLNHIYCLSALLLALCTLLASPAAQMGFGEISLSSALQKMKISPSIISIPDYVGTIKIAVAAGQVKPGDTVQFREFVNQISWEVSSSDARYTLMLLDLDRSKPNAAGPSNISAQHASIYNQYTNLNIPGHKLADGQVIVAFEAPVLPCHTNLKHRILVLAFHQPQNIDLQDVINISASSGDSRRRENFNLIDFINRHRLDLVAANAFYTSSDPAVCSGSGSTIRSIRAGSTMIFIAMVTAAASLFAWSNSNRQPSSMI